MRYMGALVVLVMGASVAAPALAADAENITARDVVERCNFKYPGDDQKTQLTIILRDKDGNEKKNVYRRFWKDYKGREGITDKMVLFTEYPTDAKGAGFMRWAYTAGADKNADQWIYLPELKKIRRVSVRDPGDSFLGSDLTYADIGIRELDADEHTIVQATQRGDEQFIVVQSMPRDKSDALYAKVVSVFVKGKDWDSCVKRQVDYFDKRGEPLKRQVIKWQQVGNAWLWDVVTVSNSQTGHSSDFLVSEASINVGLDDSVFSERNLSRGM
jgi:hypothetical protein